MGWRDRLLMKMMGNRVVIKAMSIPIVLKIITVEMKAFLWVASIFSRKKKQLEPQVSQPSDSEKTTES